jgi:hypothetical protein
MRQGSAKYVFPGNNTPLGFYSHYQNGIAGLDQVYILKGGPGVGKSSLMRKIGLAMLERGFDVEFWQCSSDNDSLDGVVIPSISTAIIDGTPPHNIDPKYPGAIEEIVDLGANWDNELLKNDRSEIVDLTDKISDHFLACYEKLAKASAILETQNADEALKLDMSGIKTVQNHIAEAIFSSFKPACRHLFSTAITPNGVVSFKESLFDLANQRFIIFGPSTYAKNLILDHIVKMADEKGHFLEIYHPPLSPQMIELLYIPTLDTVIIDSGLKQPIFTKKTDQLIDCSAFGEELSEADMKNINYLVNEATIQIASAKKLHDKLEQHYTKAMDFDKVDHMQEALFNKILTKCAQENDK